MSSVFDAVIDRRSSDSTKWGRYARSGTDVIPAWVSDMDFAAPEPVLRALHARVDQGVFGYANAPEELYELVAERLLERYGWAVDRSWFVIQPGVVPGLYISSRCAGEAGDAVLTPTPVYRHFLLAPAHAERTLLTVPSLRAGSGWQLDLDGLRSAVTDRTRLFLLCNPHNPLGRALSRAELEAVAALCAERDLLICSDEIHCDLLLDSGTTHIPIAMLGPEIAQRTITLIAPSKTFNLPGVGGLSLAIIPDAELRELYRQHCQGVVVHPGALAYAAALAAYRDCDDWLLELLPYLAANRDYLEAQIKTIPGISMTHVDSTYLAWIDFSDAGLAAPFEAMLASGLALSDGAEMGDATHLRLNFGCPRSTLEEIVSRLRLGIERAGT